MTSDVLLTYAQRTVSEDFLFQNSCLTCLAPRVLYRQYRGKNDIQTIVPRPDGMRLQYSLLATNSFVFLLIGNCLESKESF